MKNKRIWITLSAACILSGVLFTAAGIMLGGIPGFYLDRTGIHTSRESMQNDPETFRQTIELESFDRMDLKLSYADVTFVPSDRYAASYCLTGLVDAPVCQVEDKTLTFRESPGENDARIWFLYAGPSSGSRKEPIPESFLKIEYPAGKEFSRVAIDLASGNLELPLLHADTLELTNDYGDVSLEGYNGTSLLLHMSSGSLTAGSIRADQTELCNEYGDLSLDAYTGKTLDIRMSSGDLILGAVEADRADLKNEYGSVIISQASGSQLNASLDSGSFLADRLDFSSLDLKNEYASVRLKLSGPLLDYGYDLYTEYGSIRMDGQTIKPNEEGDSETRYQSEGSGPKSVRIRCESGDIIIDPAE